MKIVTRKITHVRSDGSGRCRPPRTAARPPITSLLTDIAPLLRGVVRRTWRNPQDAEDIIQDILLSVHAVCCTYDPPRPFLHWVFTRRESREPAAARPCVPPSRRGPDFPDTWGSGDCDNYGTQ